MFRACCIEGVPWRIELFQKIFKIVLKNITHVLLEYSTQVLAGHGCCILQKIVILTTEMIRVRRLGDILRFLLGMVSRIQYKWVLLKTIYSSCCKSFLVMMLPLNWYHLRLIFLTFLDIKTTHSHLVAPKNIEVLFFVLKRGYIRSRVMINEHVLLVQVMVN
jgi:hypothetical protein